MFDYVGWKDRWNVRWKRFDERFDGMFDGRLVAGWLGLPSPNKIRLHIVVANLTGALLAPLHRSLHLSFTTSPGTSRVSVHVKQQVLDWQALDSTSSGSLLMSVQRKGHKHAIARLLFPASLEALRLHDELDEDLLGHLVVNELRNGTGRNAKLLSF